MFLAGYILFSQKFQIAIFFFVFFFRQVLGLLLYTVGQRNVRWLFPDEQQAAPPTWNLRLHTHTHTHSQQGASHTKKDPRKFEI